MCRPEVERHCDVCATHLTQLTREALRLLQAPAGLEDLDTRRGGPGLTPPSPGAMTGPREAPVPAGPAGARPGQAGPDRRKGPAWPPGPSVQVSVAPAGLGGALSTVTIQAQQCLEGMWSVSRVNSFLPPSCLVSAGLLEPPGRAVGGCVGLPWGSRSTSRLQCSFSCGRWGVPPNSPTAHVKSTGKVTGGQRPSCPRDVASF